MDKKKEAKLTKKEAVIDLGSLKKGDKIEGELMDGTKFEGIFELGWKEGDPEKLVKITFKDFKETIDECSIDIARIRTCRKI